MFTKITMEFGTCSIIFTEDRRKNFNCRLGRGLIISNHLSMMDIPLITYYHNVIPLMKKEVSEIPLFGHIVEVVEPIKVDRKDPYSRKRAFEECCRRLTHGIPVQFYPEGSRSKNGQPKNFEDIYPKLIEFAYLHGISVTPVSLWGTDHVLLTNGDVQFNRPIGMITHEEIWPKDFLTAEDFSRACWRKVETGYQELERQLIKNSPQEKAVLS